MTNINRRDFLRLSGGLVGGFGVLAVARRASADVLQPQDAYYQEIKGRVSDVLEQQLWNEERVVTTTPQLLETHRGVMEMLTRSYVGDRVRSQIVDSQVAGVLTAINASFSERGDHWFSASLGIVGMAEDRTRCWVVAPVTPRGFFPDRMEIDVRFGGRTHYGRQGAIAHFEGENSVPTGDCWGSAYRGAYLVEARFDEAIGNSQIVTLRRRLVRPDGNYDSLANASLYNAAIVGVPNLFGQVFLNWDQMSRQEQWQAYGYLDDAMSLVVQTEEKMRRGYPVMPEAYQANTSIFYFDEAGKLKMTNSMKGSALQEVGSNWPSNNF